MNIEENNEYQTSLTSVPQADGCMIKNLATTTPYNTSIPYNTTILLNITSWKYILYHFNINLISI